MSGDSSEEKSLPPSQKKLREARKKGQFAKSQDVISGISMIVLVLYLILAWPSIFHAFARMFDAAGHSAAQLGPNAWRVGASEIWDSIASILLPLYALSVFAILIGSIISNKGIVFAIQPITPDLKKINPIEGFKKIFSLRNFIEFLKALVKSMLLLGTLGFGAWLGFQKMMNAPLCGEDCFGIVLIWVAAPVVFGALGLFLFSALIDSGLQRWLFTRDMRMTHTEFKREQKEQFGDPLIRKARKDIHRESAEGGTGTGPAKRYIKARQPTFIIASGSEIAIALRYVAGETPAPIVLSRAVGSQAAALMEHAYAARITVVNEPYLAEELYRRAQVDSFIPETLFREIARVMSQSGS